MYVNVEHAGIDRHLEEAFGRPEPDELELVQVFGWYHTTFDDIEGPTYWLFDPKTDVWEVKRSDDYCIPNLIVRGISSSDQAAVSEAFRNLVMIERPPAPEDCSVILRKEPFVYQDWLFRWYFFPELGRWELAPLRKRPAYSKVEIEAEPASDGRTTRSAKRDAEDSQCKRSRQKVISPSIAMSEVGNTD